MSQPAHKTQRINGTQAMRFHPSTFTGKEKDEETGYGYFGARYMDYELTTMWLSVDPMSDKYPSISPYAYCAWNPVKLVDPDGREIDDYFTKDGRYLGSDNAITNNVRIIEEDVWNALSSNGTIDHERGVNESQLLSSSNISDKAITRIYEHYWKESGHGKSLGCIIKNEDRSGKRNHHYMEASSNTSQCDDPDKYFTIVNYRILYIDHDEMKKSKICDNKYEIINLMDHEARHFTQHAMGPAGPLLNPEFDALNTQVHAPSFQKCRPEFRDAFRKRMQSIPECLRVY